MPEISRIKDQFYIVATSSVIDPFRLILKDGEAFGVFDRFGDILPLGRNEQGLYCNGTRHLSYYELKVNNARPLFLSSTIEEDNVLMAVDLTNPDFCIDENVLISRDTIHIMRSRLVLDNSCVERIRLRNFGSSTIEFEIELSFDADFRDIFEVRGLVRKKKGKLFRPEYTDKSINLRYLGLDGIKRATLISFRDKLPARVSGRRAIFKIKLEPDATEQIGVSAHCLTGSEEPTDADFFHAVDKVRKKNREAGKNTPEVQSSNEQFNRALARSISDINMMLSRKGQGFYPYGGIPWYCTPFGRDGLITALECLWFRPDIARGVLKYLSSRQAAEVDETKAAQPGKILHETRAGEMANLAEIPFGLYYGSVDSTPLYLMLAGAYWRRTGDTALIKSIWSNIEAAVNWIEEYGDIDGDGFLEYRPDVKGLRNQGWKDSQDSIFHRDGRLAKGPIALCEVQGYCYEAKKEASMLARITGKPAFAEKLAAEADELKKKFNEVFWDRHLNSYVLALDGDKQPCRVVASNAGHTLFTGIADTDKAAKVADTLLSDLVFSGWGLRTVAANEALYNPMSYHNGSVWPHDNAVIAHGFARYGLKEHFERVFTAIFEAAAHMDIFRLPELFCGFHKRRGSSPTLYPIACSPQVWASGALLMMMQAALGISFEASELKIAFKRPLLPQFLSFLYIKNLVIRPGKSIDIFLRRYGKGTTVEVLEKPEDVSILITK